MTVCAESVDGLEVLCDLCYVAVVNVSEISRDECVQPESVYSWKTSKKRSEKQDACATAESVKDADSVKTEEAAYGINFELFAVLLFGELTDDSYELRGGSARALFESFEVVLLMSTFSELFFAEKVYGRGNPQVESGQSEECSFA